MNPKYIDVFDYTKKRRAVVHTLFWFFWFLFIWSYEKNNFRPNENIPLLDFLLAVRDIVLIVTLFYLSSNYIVKSLVNLKSSKLSLLYILLYAILLYLLTYIYTYFSLAFLNELFPQQQTLATYTKYYVSKGLIASLFDRSSFWYITYWYSIYLIVPLVIKLLIEISNFRIKTLNLEKDNIRLELDYLKSQVNPHFLFNVLNSIYSIVIDSEPRAAQIVLKLSDLMRYSLYEASNDRVPLHREIQFIRDYVELEKIRHKKSTKINFHVNGNPDGLQVPPFLLITFVENAFKHGISSTIKSSWVEIYVNIQDGVLDFKVENSKPDKFKQDNIQGGIGLWNVRKRLDLLFPNKYLLDIENNISTYNIRLSLQLL